MTTPPPAQQTEADTWKRVVATMHAHGAKDDREAQEAARNLLGFAQLAMSIRRRQINNQKGKTP
jgi:hypothetical protein